MALHFSQNYWIQLSCVLESIEDDSSESIEAAFFEIKDDIYWFYQDYAEIFVETNLPGNAMCESIFEELFQKN